MRIHLMAREVEWNLTKYACVVCVLGMVTLCVLGPQMYYYWAMLVFAAILMICYLSLFVFLGEGGRKCLGLKMSRASY